MRAFVASLCFVAVIVLGVRPASADGTRRVDLVVREVPPATALELRAEEPPPVADARPARATPLHLRLDAEGRLQLLLRLSPDQFLGKLAVAL